MSWIFGRLSRHAWTPAGVAQRASVHPEPLYCLAEGSLYLTAGGLAATCRWGTTGAASGWAVVGLGMVRDGSAARCLGEMDWAARLAVPSPDFGDLDGHFAIARWQGDRVDLFTDPLGLRSLYAATTDEGVVFSTRLDWVCRVARRSDVDLEALGTHWLAFNQLVPRSLVAGVDRLGPGGHAACSARACTVRGTPWTPEAVAAGHPIEDLDAFLNPVLPSGTRLSLGLSGGLDSRMLLALLVGAERPFQLHVFGDPDDPDVRISQRIATEQGLPQQHLATALPPADACVRQLQVYAAETCASTPASAAVKLNAYGALHEQGRVVVDGGFGEIGRRQFLNRFLRRRHRALRGLPPEALMPYFRVHRAGCFDPDALHVMEQGFVAELAMLVDSLSDPIPSEPANLLDLLAIRTRLPNFYGYGQPRLDEQVVNYMPFAQPSFLRAVLATPARERTNGRLFRRTIRARAPALAQYPLVKGGTTYPFALTTVPAWAWTKVKVKAGRVYRDASRRQFLHRIADYARDLVRDETTRAFAAYDHPRLRATVDRYYAGDEALAAEVDWWLAFESWRRTLGAISN